MFDDDLKLRERSGDGRVDDDVLPFDNYDGLMSWWKRDRERRWRCGGVPDFFL